MDVESGELDASPPVLVLVRDLMFSSRIGAEARAQGASIAIVRDPSTLKDRPGRLLIVDLNLDGALKAAAEWQKATNRPVVGFVSHVDVPTIDRARAAGLDRVLPRSRFVQVLPELLAKGI